MELTLESIVTRKGNKLEQVLLLDLGNLCLGKGEWTYRLCFENLER
jgi:hypothetical protein